MATAVQKRKLTVYLAPTVAQAVRTAAARTDRPVSDVIEAALIQHLGLKALNESQALSGYTEEEAMEMANAELHAMRCERSPREFVDRLASEGE